MAFKFFTSPDIAAAKHEGVKILPGTPKNAQDYNAIQDILRYRQVMMVNELYGNTRLSIPNVTPFTKVLNKVKVNGIWYFDGYRMEINDLSSTTSLSNYNYNIFLGVNFETINFKDDNSIALQDSGTNKFIPTSERFKFNYTIFTQRNIL